MFITDTISAARMVVPEPVSIRMFGILIVFPSYETDTVVKGRLSFKNRRMASPNTKPLLFADIEFFSACMDKIKFTSRMVLVNTAVARKSRAAVKTMLDNGNLVEKALVVRSRVGL